MKSGDSLQRARTIAGPGNAAAAVRAGERAWPRPAARGKNGHRQRIRRQRHGRRRNVGKKKMQVYLTFHHLNLQGDFFLSLLNTITKTAQFRWRRHDK